MSSIKSLPFILACVLLLAPGCNVDTTAGGADSGAGGGGKDAGTPGEDGSACKVDWNCIDVDSDGYCIDTGHPPDCVNGVATCPVDKGASKAVGWETGVHVARPCGIIAWHR